MVDKVFKSRSIVELTKRVGISVPVHNNSANVDDFSEEEQEDIYQGPTIEEIEGEIATLRKNWEEELRDMRKKSVDEAARIIEDAKSQAFEIFKSKQQEGYVALESARLDAKRIIDDANFEKERMERESLLAKEDGYKQGYEEGLAKGIVDSQADVDKLLEKLKKILAETVNRRNEIIDTAEGQLVDVAISIAKRIIKKFTEDDKAIVIRNIQEALKRIKARTKIIIHVNVDDLEVSSRHKDEFYKMCSKIEGVEILEDPNVDIGGCIVETDFGDIDARISTQLNEIETAVKDVQSIKGI